MSARIILVDNLLQRSTVSAIDVKYSSVYIRVLINNLKKVKGRHLYTATYMNMTSSGLQCEVAYWPAMTLGGAAQVPRVFNA